MNRRGFLQTCLALAAAPAIVRADSLMRIVPRQALLILPASVAATLAGKVRVMMASDLVTDNVIIRLDTFNGEAQYHTDIVLPHESLDGWKERNLPAAMSMLSAYVKERHGDFAEFKAPPITPLSGVFKMEVI